MFFSSSTSPHTLGLGLNGWYLELTASILTKYLLNTNYRVLGEKRSPAKLWVDLLDGSLYYFLKLGPVGAGDCRSSNRSGDIKWLSHDVLNFCAIGGIKHFVSCSYRKFISFMVVAVNLIHQTTLLLIIFLQQHNPESRNKNSKSLLDLLLLILIL